MSGVYHLRKSTSGQRIVFLSDATGLGSGDFVIDTSSNGAAYNTESYRSSEMLTNGTFTGNATGWSFSVGSPPSGPFAAPTTGWGGYNSNNFIINGQSGTVRLRQEETSFAGGATIDINSLYEYSYTTSSSGSIGNIKAYINSPLLFDGQTVYDDDATANATKTRSVVASAAFRFTGSGNVFTIETDSDAGMIIDGVSLVKLETDVIEIGNNFYSVNVPEELSNIEGPLFFRMNHAGFLTFVECFIEKDSTTESAPTLTAIRNAVSEDHGIGSYADTTDFTSTDRTNLGAIKTKTDNLPADTDADLTVIDGNVDTINTNTAAIKTKTDFLPSATAGAASGVSIVGSQMDLVDAPNATAITAIQAGHDTVGSGADSVTLNFIDDASDPVENMQVWISTDAAGTNVIAGTRLTDSNGNITFLLDAGNTYYKSAQKSGVTSVINVSFVAVAD